MFTIFQINIIRKMYYVHFLKMVDFFHEILIFAENPGRSQSK